MYKHKKKSSRDVSEDSPRPSTRDSGRLSQLSNSSNRPASGSTSRKTHNVPTSETAGEKKGSKDEKEKRMPSVLKPTVSKTPNVALVHESRTIQTKSNEEEVSAKLGVRTKSASEKAIHTEPSKNSKKEETSLKTMPSATIIAPIPSKSSASVGTSNPPAPHVTSPSSSTIVPSAQQPPTSSVGKHASPPPSNPLTASGPPPPRPNQTASGAPPPQPNRTASDAPPPPPNQMASGPPPPRPNQTASGAPPPPSNRTASGAPPPPPNRTASDAPPPPPNQMASGPPPPRPNQTASGAPPPPPNRTATGAPPPPSNRTATDAPPPPSNRTASDAPPLPPNQTASGPPPPPSNQTASGAPPPPPNRTASGAPPPPPNRTASGAPPPPPNRTASGAPPPPPNRTASDAPPPPPNQTTSGPPPAPPSPYHLQKNVTNESSSEDHWAISKVQKVVSQSVMEYASIATGKLGNLELDANELLNQKKMLKKVDPQIEGNPEHASAPTGEHGGLKFLHANVLLNQKRKLKKVDRHTEYNPVTLSRKELFEEEYDRNGETPPEHFPLHVVKPTIISQNISADLFTLNLNGIDQLTDFLFPLLLNGNLAPCSHFMNLKKLLLNGCLHLTDQALKWIAIMFPKLQMLEINACRKITEKGLHHLFEGCPELQNLSAMATNISLIPDSIMSTKLPKGSIQWAGSPVISEGPKFRTFRGADGEMTYFEATKRKLVILREASIEEAVTPLLTGDSSKSSKLFCYKQWQTELNPGSPQPQMLFNIFEVAAFSPLQDSLVTEGSIILIACKPPKPEDLLPYVHKVTEIITSVIVKCPDVVFLLAEMTENGNATSLKEKVLERLSYLSSAMLTATFDLYRRNWNLECLDFKGQQGLSFGTTSYEALGNLVQNGKLISAAVTKGSFQKTLVTALTKCSEMVKALVPWVHCEWAENLKEVIDDIPKSAAATQEDISKQTDKATKTILHKRYAYPRIGKVLNLLQNWGEAVYHWHSLKILCVSDLTSYENVIVKLMATPVPDKVKISFCEDVMPCWKIESLQNFLKSHNASNVKPEHLASLLKRQGLFLSVQPHMLESSNLGDQEIYIKMEDLPKEPKILKYLWPEPTPVTRVLQHNRCYNLLPGIPPLFMSKLLRTLLKVFQPLYIWKTGFLVRQGPVDVKASLLKYKGERLDDTPVLVLSARVVYLGMDIKIRPDVDENTSASTARRVMHACMRQVMAVVDYTCIKTKVYPCITLPCPECAQFKTEKMVDIEHNWHLPYYIALASKRRCCPTHKNITASLLCDVEEDKGEGCTIPQHNFSYQSASTKFIKQLQAKNHFREMDPPENCFYCGRGDEEPCMRCVMCSKCLRQFAKFAKVIQPGHVTSQSFKLQMFKDGQLQDDERIISNTKGCVYYYKRGHSMQMLDVMAPFYWDQLGVTALKTGNFYLHFTFGSGKRIEYHSSGVIVDQHGHSHTDESWKCRDATYIVIRMEAVQLGKRVRVIIQLKEREVYREEIDAWYMKFDLNTGKPGIYILHASGIKLAWNFINNGSKLFTVGSTLEVKDGNEIHPAVIKEQKNNGYLLLDVNGKEITYISTSPNIMPTGTAGAQGEALASQLPEEDMDQPPREPVHLRAFHEYQVPSGFDALFEKAEKERLLKPKPRPTNQGNSSNEESANDGTTKFKKGLLARWLEKCTFFDFPSVWYGRQTHMKEPVERAFYNEGKWNFSMNSLLMLPKLTTKEDLINPSQSLFAKDFILHPLCYFRGDVTTVMSSSPTNKQAITQECFHNLHMLDNEGFQLDLTGRLGSFIILWAWSLLLLRLQMQEDFPEYKLLLTGVDKAEELTSHQINQGLRKLVKAVSHAIFLSLGEGFDLKLSLTEENIQPWQELMTQHAEKQGLVKVKNLYVDDTWLMCETHAGCWQVNQNLASFSSLPGPYLRYIYSMSLSNNDIKEIPAGFFANMPHLKDVDLSCNQLTVLPGEIGMCQQLMSLNIFDNQLKTLPDELSKCQMIFRVFMDKNDMSELPQVITQLKGLQRLYAQFLHLRYLPENIGDLTELKNLSLNGNCFRTLPDSMRNLTKLENLSLNGVAWMRSRSNVVLSKDHFEDFLRNNNLHRWLERYDQDRSSIFQFFDEDTNGTLDAKEIGKLNALMFHIFPRFGYQGNDPDEDTPSGFPEVLFELPSLEYLSMQYHGLVSVPENIKKLTKLHTLHLGNNPNLLTISAQIGNNPLKRLELDGCPRLKTPPKEIRAKGFLTTFAYLKRLLSGSVTCKRTKLMLVGLGGAGKTSLVKSLLSKEKCTELTVGEEITDGIDICPWTVPTDEGDIVYSVWDFAGQTVYYNTHQFFLSDRAVYLLLWNIRLGHEHAGLSFWLSSIMVHAPNAPIFVVGTHVDQVSKIELPINEMQKKFPQIYGFHFVSSHTGQGIPELQQHLVSVTLKQKYMGEKIPGVWLSLEESLKSIADRKVIHYGEVQSKAQKCGIFDKTEIAQAVQFLHELGSVQHFTNASLKTHVVINPQWIVDVMACVVSVKDSPIQVGRLNHSDLGKVWKGYKSPLHKWMLKLTEEFDLTFPLKDEPVNLVPCLLPEKRPEFTWPDFEKDSYNTHTKILYKFDYLPAGLFNRGQVRLHQFSDSSLIWKRGSYLKKNGHVCLIYQSDDCELTVKAYGPRPENLVLLVHEVFETLILESFKGITYDFFLPCPDCMSMVVKDPHMFSASIIRRATELKAPFLQCLKYFHTISITDLHASMPPDSSIDFDLHLVQAVRGLKELQENVSAEVFVCFCPADLEKKDADTVLPAVVAKDVQKLGYKCWIPHDITKESTDEMAKALLDAKVFLVFMSNNFVQDETCCNLFKYARLTLKKPIILVATGEDLSWKQSSMGILMADEVFVNMMKLSRYPHKFPELEAMLQDKLCPEKKNVKKSFPPCFISYSWQNSAQAVAKGSKSTEGAVGFGDPRDIKDYLENNGIKCWIDVERVGIHGLFEDIGEGLINCRVVVVCISDQYAASDNCAMEFRYAANSLKLPIVLAVVGTGNKWRASELGIMTLNYPLVSFQEKSSSSLDKLLSLVRNHIPKNAEGRKETENKMEGKENDNVIKERQQLSFQELCELAQRKFLKQVSQYTDDLDSLPYPNIMVVDLCPQEKGQIELPEKASMPEKDADKSPTGQPELTPRPTGTLNFHDQAFCVHLLCEHEEGWHMSGKAIPLSADFGHSLDLYLAYLARVTAIAKFSKKIILEAQASDVGRAYLRWLEENPNAAVSTEFQGSYENLRQLVIESDTGGSMGQLKQCLLPSGKHIWLCESHRDEMRVTVLARESVVGTAQHKNDILGVDYMLQALEELNMDSLPQQIKNKQNRGGSEEAKNKIQGVTNTSSPKSLKSGDHVDSSASQKGVSTHVTDSPPKTQEQRTSQQQQQQQQMQQRPTISRGSSKSRACLLM